jgi:hypothetical protein
MEELINEALEFDPANKKFENPIAYEHDHQLDDLSEDELLSHDLNDEYCEISKLIKE